LQVEHPVRCRDATAFHFHPTLACIQGPALVGDQVVEVREAGEKRRLTALSQSWLLEAKSESRLSENQLLASLNFPVFGNLRQSLQKTHFHYLATAMAINLQRFVDWVWEIPRAKTRQSHFARLELAA
jgi:hypothetical protein